MTTQARLVVWLGIGMAVCMFLYPPWMLLTVHGFDYYGYFPLWHPPDEEPRRIDWVRLGLQWLVTAVVTASLVIALNRKGTPSPSP